MSYVRTRSPFHDFGLLHAAGARVPHYIRAERPLFGRCGTSPVSSATCIRLTSSPMFSPKSVNMGWGWDRAPAPPLWALLACIGKPGHRYAGVREELTTGFPRSRGLSRCPCARPRHCYLHNSCCISGGVFLARICRGARTCVSVLYPHGQSVG